MTFDEWWKKYGSQFKRKSAEDIAAEAWTVSRATERTRAAQTAREHGRSVGCMCGHFDACPHVGQTDVAYKIAKAIESGVEKIR